MSAMSTGMSDAEKSNGKSIPVPRAAFSIDEFCAAHGISRAMFYKLEDQGLAPRTMRVGVRRLITAEAAAKWRRAREAA